MRQTWSTLCTLVSVIVNLKVDLQSYCLAVFCCVHRKYVCLFGLLKVFDAYVCDVFVFM